MNVSIFGSKQDSTFIGMENNGFGSMRGFLTGTQFIAVVSVNDGAALAKSKDLKKVIKWLTSLGAAAVPDAVELPSLTYGTVKAGDFLYVPMGSLLLAKTVNENAVGLKMTTLVVNENMAESYSIGMAAYEETKLILATNGQLQLCRERNGWIRDSDDENSEDEFFEAAKADELEAQRAEMGVIATENANSVPTTPLEGPADPVTPREGTGFPPKCDVHDGTTGKPISDAEVKNAASLGSPMSAEDGTCDKLGSPMSVDHPTTPVPTLPPVPALPGAAAASSGSIIGSPMSVESATWPGAPAASSDNMIGSPMSVEAAGLHDTSGKQSVVSQMPVEPTQMPTVASLVKSASMAVSNVSDTVEEQDGQPGKEAEVPTDVATKGDGMNAGAPDDQQINQSVEALAGEKALQ
eukprot:12412896-Karenia_brevis.AAC.1